MFTPTTAFPLILGPTLACRPRVPVLVRRPSTRPAECDVLCLLGGVAGTTLGLMGTAAYAAAHSWPAVIPIDMAEAGLAAAVLTGVIAGVYPAVRASRLTPTEALAAP